MPKPAITKRTTKASALTYSELDTNFQNLADATLALKAGTSGTSVVSDLNGVITLVAGTGITLAGDNTAKTLTITSDSAQNTFSNISVGGNTLVADSTSDTLVITTGAGMNITSSAGSDTINFAITTTSVTPGNYTAATISVDSTGRITAAASNSISNFVTLDTSQTITGAKTLNGLTTLKQYSEFVYAGGNTGTATYTPTLGNGAVQKITATGNFTLGSPSGMTSGTSICIIVQQDSTGGRLMSSSAYLWAGGVKTLSTNPASIDLITIFFDGTYYLASLNKGYA